MSNNLMETVKTTPLDTVKSVRSFDLRGKTSAFAGRIHPVQAFAMLREDRVQDLSLSLSVEQMETPEMLMNATKITARAVFVPWAAFERFEGSMDRFNRSYEGQPDKEGGDVVPFFTMHNYSASSEFYRALGKHAPEATQVNAMYIEAYNEYCNFLYRNMSNKLPQRNWWDSTLAACPWSNNTFRHIVPDFDAALIDAQLDLNIQAAAMPIKSDNVYATSAGRSVPGALANPPLDASGDYDWTGEIWAEMQQQGVTLSLANIEQAKKTAAFARIREKMKGLEDDHIIDLLMQGIRVPDAQMTQPILLAKNSTIVGYNRRYATDSGNLDKSVTRGETGLDLRVRTPAMNTGGVVLVTVEVVPEQIYERIQDPFFFKTTTDELPSFTRDYLDPEKVAVVQNKFVDVLHATPDGTFGYAPLNHEYKSHPPAIGGKYMRPANDAFNENRQALWTVEQLNPQLTEDFYLATNIHHDVFADTVSEPFEITSVGGAAIVGHTVFGKGLSEDTGSYDAIADDVDNTRIEQPPA